MPAKKYTAPEQYMFVPVGFVVDNMFKGGSYSLSLGYTDHSGKIADSTTNSKQKGRYVEYITSKDGKGKDVAKRFNFNQSLGRLLTRPSDTDIYGKSQYEFLKNHAECEGSPNGVYENVEGGGKIQVGVTFRELDSAKDASVALRSDKLRVKAQASALELDEQTLEEIANIINYFGEVDDQMVLKVVEFAGKKPGEYNELLKSEDRGVRAIIRRAIEEKIFNDNGVIKWDTTLIGNSEDDAVIYLRKNSEMLEALQRKMGMDVVDIKPKTKKADA